MARYNKGLKAGNMTQALGRMVGLLLSLYVFDQVISAVVPSMVVCPYSNYTALTNATFSYPQCYNNSLVTSHATGTISTHFTTALTFVGNLFPVIGILGAFEIIYSAGS